MQAVVVLGDEEGGVLLRLGVAQRAGHREATSDVGDGGLDGDAVGAQVGQVDPDALEELAALGVGVLVGGEDVGAVSVEDLSERGDDALLIGAGDEEGQERLCHGASG